MAAIWIIWKAGCRRVYQKDFLPSLQVARWVLNFSREIVSTIRNKASRCASKMSWVSWVPPARDVIKLNIDGSALRPNCHAAAGGIFRDFEGAWVAGFSANVGTCLVVAAELWGVREGLLAFKKGFRSIELEVDSMVLVDMLIREELF
ncbi:Ribonuclease H domain [Dillenia turbinata]|uniref:Ribonuclease H domain n=1 Tax=Dillenia turbinata TaxID=194707 RepID=A0AAN8W335_9MAGN